MGTARRRQRTDEIEDSPELSVPFEETVPLVNQTSQETYCDGPFCLGVGPNLNLNIMFDNIGRVRRPKMCGKCRLVLTIHKMMLPFILYVFFPLSQIYIIIVLTYLYFK